MNIQCLINAIGEADANALAATMNGLPTTQIDLLRVIAAALINTQGETSGEVILGGTAFAALSAVNTPLNAPPADAKYATITAYDSDVVFTLDGADPDYSTGKGHFLPMETTININSADFAGVIFKPTGGTNANIYVTYSK